MGGDGEAKKRGRPGTRTHSVRDVGSSADLHVENQASERPCPASREPAVHRPYANLVNMPICRTFPSKALPRECKAADTLGRSLRPMSERLLRRRMDTCSRR